MVLSIEPVPEDELAAALARLPGWRRDGKAIVLTEAFPKYLEALDFVYRVGLAAEEANHHPDILMNFRNVTVRYWTHKIDGVSRGDLIMAARVSEILREFIAGR